MSDVKLNGPMAVVAAAVLWGTAGTAGVLALGAEADVAPVSLAAARLVIGGLVLALVAGGGAWSLLVGGRRPAETRVAGTRLPRIGAAGKWLLLAAGAVAAYQLAFFGAVSRTGVAVGTVVAIGSGPVFTGVLSWLLDGVRPSARWAAATAAAVAGCAALVAGGGADVGGEAVTGVLLALLGGLLYAFYAVTAARLIGAGMPSNAVMGAMFGGAAVVMLPVLLWTGPGWLATPGGLVTALYLGCATTGLSYFLYGKGLRTTPVAAAATLALAEPAVAALLGLAVLGERLPVVSFAGLGLLGVALVVVAVPERSREGAESSA